MWCVSDVCGAMMYGVKTSEISNDNSCTIDEDSRIGCGKDAARGYQL